MKTAKEYSAKEHKEVLAQVQDLSGRIISEKDSHPTIAVLFAALLSFFQSFVDGYNRLFQQFKNIQKENKALRKKYERADSKVASLYSTIDEYKKDTKEQKKTIAALTSKNQLLERTVAELKATNRSLGGRAFSSSKTEENIPTTSDTTDPDKDKDRSEDEKAATKKAKTKRAKPSAPIRQEDVYLDWQGNHLTKEQADALIGTTFTDEQSRTCVYTGFQDSSRKDITKVERVRVQYHKPTVKLADANGQVIPGSQLPPRTFPETDFLFKTSMSLEDMVSILVLWLVLQVPLARISRYRTGLGFSCSKQQLYSYVEETGYMMKPLFLHMLKALGDSNRLFIDETFWSCREKLKISPDDVLDIGGDTEGGINWLQNGVLGTVGGAPPPDKGKKGSGNSHNKQQTEAKSMRSYIFAIVCDHAAFYFHSVVRDSMLPLKILAENDMNEDAFIMSDAFYKYFKKMEEDGCLKLDDDVRLMIDHGLCWVHVKRYFNVIINLGKDNSGQIIQSFKEQGWEADVFDAEELRDLISACFHKFNEILKRCEENPELDVVALKNEELKPMIDRFFEKCRMIMNSIKKDAATGLRNCSKKFWEALHYAVNNEAGLRAFLDSPYGVMHNNPCESKFRSLDILRNSMKANDTIHGAETQALFYSFYVTCEMNGVNFEEFLTRALTTLTRHKDKIEFLKNDRGSVIGYKSHCIPDEILNDLLPWNMLKGQEA